MGWGIEWVSSGGSDFNRDLGFLHTEEELKPFLEGEIPATVEENASEALWVRRHDEYETS